MKRTCLHCAAWMRIAVFLGVPSIAWAQTAPPLGTAQQFGALGNSGVTGATGSGVVVSGDVGSSPTPTISNFPPSSSAIPFTVHKTNDGVVQQAHANAATAYGNLLGQGPGTVLPDDLSTAGALGPGSYSFVSGAPDLPASATLTLNGNGIFVFNANSLTANVMSSVVGNANPCNVYWRIGTSATLNGTTFWGTVIASASITVGAGANLIGRALAGTGVTGALTMSGSGGNTIGGCSNPPACPLITIAPPTLPLGTMGVAYRQQLTASGGSGAYTFAVSSGTLPPDLTLSPGGLLSGTPTTAGSTTVTIRATDGNGCPGLGTYTIVIAAATCPAITIAPPTLPLGKVGVAYSQQLTASGGSGAYTFAVSSGNLPLGLTLTPGGLLSGTPTTAGSPTVTIRATDGNGCPGLITYTLVVAPATCPVITITPPTLPPGSVDVAYSQQLTASGGSGAYTFTVSSGTLPTGLTLSPSGLLSGTPTTVGSPTVVIQANDGNGCPGLITYTIAIANGVPTLPPAFIFLLGLGLAGVGLIRLRRRTRAERR